MSRKYTYAQEVCIRCAGKAMQQTDMLFPGARVGVALSGGMDSFVLTKVLHIRQRIVPFHFELMAIHLNPGFDPENHGVLLPWLAQHGIPAHIECTTHGLEAHSDRNRKRSACFRCSWLRRKRLFDLVQQYHLTHLAFGHNADDLISTFFLNICRNGRVDGMSMNESFFSGRFHVIRPFLLLEKKYIRSAARQWDLPVFQNPCPSAGKTARSEMHARIESLLEGIPDGRNSCIHGITHWQFVQDIESNRTE